MKRMKKFLAAALAVMALAAMNVVPALAASGDEMTVNLYAYDEDNDAYIASAHADSCVASCIDNGDGTYDITFKVISNRGAIGYISEFAGKGVDYDSTEEGSLSTPVTFEPDPTVDPGDAGVDNGSVVDFTVSAVMGTTTYDHQYSNGAIVIE